MSKKILPDKTTGQDLINMFKTIQLRLQKQDKR